MDHRPGRVGYNGGGRGDKIKEMIESIKYGETYWFQMVYNFPGIGQSTTIRVPAKVVSLGLDGDDSCTIKFLNPLDGSVETMVVKNKHLYDKPE